MIINSKRTINHMELTIDNLISGVYQPRANTTLNEKFGIYPAEPAGSDINHTIKYVVLGIGGGNSPYNGYNYSEHDVLDCGLFEHIPFIIRPVNNDISVAEQAKYRMKVTSNINGTMYYEYHLKLLKSTDIKTDTIIVDVTGGGGAIHRFDTNNADYLNPIPNLNPAKVSNQFITKTAKIMFSLTPNELIEVNNSIRIISNTTVLRPITEIGICGGLEKTINNVNIAIQTQIYFHIGVNIDTQLNYDPIYGYQRAIEVSGGERINV